VTTDDRTGQTLKPATENRKSMQPLSNLPLDIHLGMTVQICFWQKQTGHCPKSQKITKNK